MVNQTKMGIIVIIVVIPLASFVVWNTDQSVESFESGSKTQEINVLASFYPIEEFAKKVGKDKVNVSLLVNPSVEPHNWRPSIKDIQRMQKSDLIIINGLGIENWVDNISAINSDVSVVDTSFGIKPIKVNPENNLDFLGRISWTSHF